VAALPASQHTTAQKIVDMWAAKPQDHREHLGASLIGHECDRYLWLTFRWAAKPTFGGRMLRLFDTGKREEARVYEELRSIGIILHTEEDGKQIDCRDVSGHFGGSVDGVGLNFPEAPKTWAVLECKTHNSKSFKDLKDKGVRDSKPRHFAQMQTYMGLLDLERAMYYAVCKETDEVYTEWVHFEKDKFNDLLARANRIIAASEPPQKLSEDPANWQCKNCDFYDLCHQSKVAAANCRSCCHASPVENGAWHCDAHNKKLTAGEQREGCISHLFIPALVPYGEPIDGGVGFVEYRHRDTGKTFRNGPGHYSSKELSAAVAEVVTDPTVEEIRAKFVAKIVESSQVASKRKNSRVDLSKLPAADEPILNDDLDSINWSGKPR
jgi:CRISPR/Cas system-associated exonuclease Cas4 (RecB family)